MQLRALLSSLALFLLGSLGMPADAQTFPSLGRRAVESRDFDAEQRAAEKRRVEMEADEASDPVLKAAIAKLDADAKAGAGAFNSAYAAASPQIAAAANASVADDAYAVAQTAISRLETSRNQTVTALASLDSLYIQRLAAIADGDAAGGATAIDATRIHALALVDSQNDRLDALKARLPNP